MGLTIILAPLTAALPAEFGIARCRLPTLRCGHHARARRRLVLLLPRLPLLPRLLLASPRGGRGVPLPLLSIRRDGAVMLGHGGE